MEIVIDGLSIKTERDFHRMISSQLGISGHYGENLHALWDVLSASVERPVTLIWTNSERSKQELGNSFDLIVNVLRRVEEQDRQFGLAERFSFKLM